MLIVTGCCGFVGKTLTTRLLTKGYRVLGIDNLYRPGSLQNLSFLQSDSNYANNFHFVLGDVSKIDLAFINADVEAVFHLAGQVAMTKSIENPIYDFNANALSTLRLLESLRRSAPNATLIYASSNKVYGDLEYLKYTEEPNRYACPAYPDGFDETLPLDFSSPYGCSKGSADQYVKDYSKLFGLRTFCFRHSTIYGAGQKASYDQGWVGWFLLQIVKSRIDSAHSFTISGNGKQVRDILHVDDVCHLYELAAFGNLASCVANVGGGVQNSLSIHELIKYACRVCNVDPSSLNIQYIKVRQADQKVFISSNSSLHKLGWVPQITYMEGVKEILTNLIDYAK
jgi:CDP-paratose 2-epimerase